MPTLVEGGVAVTPSQPADLGLPSISIAEGVDAFVRWQQDEWRGAR